MSHDGQESRAYWREKEAEKAEEELAARCLAEGREVINAFGTLWVVVWSEDTTQPKAERDRLGDAWFALFNEVYRGAEECPTSIGLEDVCTLVRGRLVVTRTLGDAIALLEPGAPPPDVPAAKPGTAREVVELRERVAALEEACDIFQEGSASNAAVFDVLLAAGLVSQEKPGPPMADTVRTLVRRVEEMERLVRDALESLEAGRHNLAVRALRKAIGEP